MNVELQRIAIAEACGRVRRPDNNWYPEGSKVGSQGIPDYLNDLNAMHEAEKKLNGKQWLDYEDHLLDACVSSKTNTIQATAPQRAKAYLKTLGKWEESI